MIFLLRKTCASVSKRLLSKSWPHLRLRFSPLFDIWLGHPSRFFSARISRCGKLAIYRCSIRTFWYARLRSRLKVSWKNMRGSNIIQKNRKWRPNWKWRLAHLRSWRQRLGSMIEMIVSVVQQRYIYRSKNLQEVVPLPIQCQSSWKYEEISPYKFGVEFQGLSCESNRRNWIDLGNSVNRFAIHPS